MAYVDGYLLPIPTKNLTAYKRMARLGQKLWLAAGALDYKECVGEDLVTKFGLPFGKTLKLVPLSGFVPGLDLFKFLALPLVVGENLEQAPQLRPVYGASVFANVTGDVGQLHGHTQLAGAGQRERRLRPHDPAHHAAHGGRHAGGIGLQVFHGLVAAPLRIPLETFQQGV